MPDSHGLILIIDDDRSVAQLWDRIIASQGYRAVIARTGEEGYAALAELGAAIQLVLMDLGLPDMDGCGFRKLQLGAGQMADIPTVVVTGRTLTLAETSQLRAAAVLTKPISVDTLRRCITAHVRTTPVSAVA